MPTGGQGAHRLRGRCGTQDIPLSLAFLILLPFYGSLGPMLAWRFAHGLWFDTIGLMVFSLIFTALMALLGIQIYQSIRSKVVLGERAVRITLPQGSGAIPMLQFVDREVPYEQIQVVETRCVLFGNVMAPVLLRATRLLTKDGGHIRLGTVNEDNVDQALPFSGDREQDRRTSRRRHSRWWYGTPFHRAAHSGLHPPQNDTREQSAPHRRGAQGPTRPSQASDALFGRRSDRARRRRYRGRCAHRTANVIRRRGRISAREQALASVWRTH